MEYDCDDSASFDLISDMISKDELSIDYDDSASLDLIGDMISNDELSINNNSSQSPLVMKNKHLSSESTPITPTSTSTDISSICKASLPRSQRIEDIKNKQISLEDKYQWHKLEPNTKPPRCNKNKLRSLEVKCQQQKFRESKEDAVRCTDITNVVTDA